MKPRMVADDERREAARRLREYSGGRKAFHLGRLCAACGIDKSRLMSRTTDADAEAWAHLADLIEPSGPKVKCVAEAKFDGERPEQLAYDAAVELTGIDRAALLALADNLDSSASMLLKQNGLDPNRKRRGMRRDHAQSLMAASGHIREACGEAVRNG